jgi:hypothetical protein
MDRSMILARVIGFQRALSWVLTECGASVLCRIINQLNQKTGHYRVGSISGTPQEVADAEHIQG